MSSTVTAITIIVVIGVLISVAVIIQNFENQRQQKRAYIQAIRNRIRHVEQLYDTLPNRLTSEQLNHFISHYLHSQWKKIISLDSNASLQQAAQQSQDKLSAFEADNTYSTGALTLLSDQLQAQKAMLAARELSQWLQSLKKNNSTQTISDLLSYLQYCHAQASIDCMIFDAIECEQAKGAKVSIPQYNSCLTTLNNMHYSQKNDRQVFELHNHIEALSTSAGEQE